MSENRGTLEGWRVTFAGTGINLALGVLYAWSILSGGIEGWTETMKSLPYSLACGVFAITMIPAGRLQDRIGPRWVATVSGLMTGIGFIPCWAYTSFAGFLVGFGLLVGIGIGFGYAAATPPAIKWFHATRTGLIAGLVVSGFGLASAYIGPLARTMIDAWGLQTSMLVMGLAFLVVARSSPSGSLTARPGLQDGYVELRLDPAAWLRVGQMLVPYDWESNTSPPCLPLAGLGAIPRFFGHGRDLPFAAPANADGHMVQLQAQGWF